MFQNFIQLTAHYNTKPCWRIGNRKCICNCITFKDKVRMDMLFPILIMLLNDAIQSIPYNNTQKSHVIFGSVNVSLYHWTPHTHIFIQHKTLCSQKKRFAIKDWIETWDVHAIIRIHGRRTFSFLHFLLLPHSFIVNITKKMDHLFIHLDRHGLAFAK